MLGAVDPGSVNRTILLNPVEVEDEKLNNSFSHSPTLEYVASTSVEPAPSNFNFTVTDLLPLYIIEKPLSPADKSKVVGLIGA